MKTTVETISINLPTAAKATGLAPSTLRRDANAGKIPAARKVNGRFVFMMPDFRDWVNAQTVPAGANAGGN